MHRRCLHDDGRGVGEPLNETGVSGLGLVITGDPAHWGSPTLTLAGVHRVILDTAARSVALHHANSQAQTFPALLAFAPLAGSVASFVQTHHTNGTALRQPVRTTLFCRCFLYHLFAVLFGQGFSLAAASKHPHSHAAGHR